jgi:signal transduction histidine kinase
MNQSKWAPRKIANLRHDLSTPLNAIIGYCELLIEECKEKGFNEYISDLQKCINASKNLLNIIRKGLDPSRFENLNPAQQVSIFDADIDFQLRTSLNTIIGYIELALENAEDEACNELVPDLNKIHSAAILFQEWIHKVNVVELTSDEEISEYDGSATSSDIQSQEIMIQPMDEDVVLSAQKCEGHILVVDDNPMNQDTLSRYLNRLGHKVSMAENGK